MIETGADASAAAFKVPAAVADDGRLVTRGDARKGERYHCPACDASLVFKAGPIRSRHFAHAPTLGCHPETALHQTAKRLVAQVVEDWLAWRGPAPVVAKRCGRCFKASDQPLGGRIDAARVEHRLADGLVADVALLRGDAVAAVVEILVTHAVDHAKEQRLSVPWLELEGAAVVGSPLRWCPVSSGNTKRYVCESCLARHREAVELCRTLGLDYDAEEYVPGAVSCYRCSRRTPVFAWRPTGYLFKTEPPPDLVPKTIQFRYSQTAGCRYWANTCLHCGALFGDHFLVREPDSPLYGVALAERPRTSKPPTKQRTAPSPPGYMAEVVRCGECDLDTRYYSWRGEEPPEPRPDSVYLDGGRPKQVVEGPVGAVTLPAAPDTWQNHCGYCDASLER